MIKIFFKLEYVVNLSLPYYYSWKNLVPSGKERIKEDRAYEIKFNKLLFLPRNYKKKNVVALVNHLHHSFFVVERHKNHESYTWTYFVRKLLTQLNLSVEDNFLLGQTIKVKDASSVELLRYFKNMLTSRQNVHVHH